MKERNYNSRTEKDYNLWRAIYYKWFVYFVVMPISKLMYNIKIEGRENVPEGSRLIFAGNHVSYLDPPMLSYAVQKLVAYMGKKELFESKNELLKFLVHSLGGFAVNREKLEVSTIKTAINVLKTNRWRLGIFPQGGIKRNKKIEKVNKGVAIIAKQMKTDILPLGIIGCEEYKDLCQEINNIAPEMIKNGLTDIMTDRAYLFAINDGCGFSTAINKLAEKYDMPILYSCHPRSKKRLEISGFKLDERVIQHEPLGFHDYNCLQMNAYAVVSDSGTLPEESSFFTSIGKPFPAVCIRTSTERPEALDKACFVLAGISEKSLLQAVDTAVMMNANNDLGIPVPDYVDEIVSNKVVKLIQSYTGVVNKMVWRKTED